MTLLENRRARMRYAAQESFAAGLELLGTEVKALRAKQGSLDGSHIVVRGGEAYLIGATIPPYQNANAKEYDPERSRRLLLKKDEIRQLADAESKKGLTIVPFELYTSGRNIKARVVIVRGKGKADRREDIKKRDAERETQRVLKSR